MRLLIAVLILTSSTALAQATKPTTGEAIPEIGFARLKTMGETLLGKRVKLSDVTFEEANNAWTDQLRGVNIVMNDLNDNKSTRILDRWMGFAAVDSLGADSALCFARKDMYGEKLVTWKRGQRLNLIGRVVKLHDPGWYGLIVDRIEESVASR
jgi:hypothetical protein